MARPDPQDFRHFYAFGSFRLEPDRRRLWRDGNLVPVYPKAIEALTVLVRHAGEVLPRERLMEELWHDNIVEDSNLTVAISHLRKVLAENGSGSEDFIETIPRVGYRFIAQAHEVIEPLTFATNNGSSHRNAAVGATDDSPFEVVPKEISPRNQEPDPRFRPKSIWFGALGAGAVLLAGIILFGTLREPPPIEAASIVSVAVLPLKTLTDTKEQDYLVDGLTEGLIHSLARIKDLKVISRGSVFVFKNQEVDPQEVGRRLRVTGVIEGSVQRRADRARVLLRLVSTKDGKVIWSTETLEQPMSELFQLEDGLSRSVSAALRPELEREEAAQLARGQTKSLQAQQAYFKGLYFWNKRTFDDLQKSVGYFNDAIDKDPGYALAHAGLADAYALFNYYGGSHPDEVYPKARQAAQRALELDEGLAQAHASLAYIKRAYDWDWAGAEREFRRAIELNPNYATAHFWYGEQLSLLGRFDEGIAEIQRAEEIDPLSPIICSSVGWAFHMARQPDRAIAQLQKSLELDRNYAMTHFYLGMAYEAKEMYPEAITAYRKSEEIYPLGPAIVGLGHAYAGWGRPEEARRILQQLVERVAHHQARPTGVAIVAAGLNDADTAFKWMDRAYEERAEGVVYLKAQPYLDNLRSDPRRAAFLRRIGLAEL